MGEVEIFGPLSAIHSLMQEDAPAAISMMAALDVAAFLNEEDQASPLQQALSRRASAASKVADATGHHKDHHHAGLQHAMAASHARQVPGLERVAKAHNDEFERHINLSHRLQKKKGQVGESASKAPEASKWSDEAHYYTRRADRIERMKHAPHQLKVDSHIEAHQAHEYAASKHRKGGDAEMAKKHDVFAQHHASRLNKLSPGKAPVHEDEEGDEDPSSKIAAAKKRIIGRQKPDTSMGFPKGESIENWAVDLDEDKYSDEVKNASKSAADATKRATEPSANADTHAVAYRAHYTAHHVALANGHTDSAAKHKTFMAKHQEAAKKAIAAS